MRQLTYATFSFLGPNLLTSLAVLLLCASAPEMPALFSMDKCAKRVDKRPTDALALGNTKFPRAGWGNYNPCVPYDGIILSFTRLCIPLLFPTRGRALRRSRR